MDSNSGLTAQITGLTVDMTNSVSKDAFVAALNLSGATGQTDTVVTGANAFSSTIGGTLDLTNSGQLWKSSLCYFCRWRCNNANRFKGQINFYSLEWIQHPYHRLKLFLPLMPN